MTEGPSTETPEIIRRPDLVPRRKRAVSSGVTLLAWAIWIYLFLPLFSLLAWWLGIELFAGYMLDPDERGYLITLTSYLIVIAICALIILGWSRYNQLRFRGKDRRSGAPPVTDEMVQQRFHLDAESLATIHSSKVIVLHLNEEGLVEAIEQKVPR